MPNREVPTQMDFEIINITPIDKYISECEIKVFYYGKNRNRSYISKAVGNQIANSLPRTPIVALYDEQIEDYSDHAEEIIINKDGVKFIKKTIPYGAVSETAPIVWKKFLDKDGVEREYMVAKGYLWTGRYPHLQKVIENPKGQSMEFFEESVVGNWAKFDNDDSEFFIFNEADISALCILGDDVEPCFEGSAIGRPEVLYSLKKNEFKQEFNNFMLELDKVLDHNSTEGGIAVEKENKDINLIENGLAQHTDVKEEPKLPNVEETEAEAGFRMSIGEKAAGLAARLKADKENNDPKGPEAEALLDEVKKDGVEIVEGNKEEPSKEVPTVEEGILEVAEEDKEATEEEEIAEGAPLEPEVATPHPGHIGPDFPVIEKPEVDELEVTEPEVIVNPPLDTDGESILPEAEFAALVAKNEELVKELNDLKAEFALLNEERGARELATKEEVCNKFSILGEDVLSQFRDNLSKYTAEELEKELSVVAFNKGITFNLLTQKEGIVTPVPNRTSKTVPAWIQAVENKENAE